MSQRSHRVAELIKQEVSALLQRGLKDPRIGFVTVTDVEVTRDLRNAKIYVSVLGNDEARKETMSGLNAALGFIRREIGQHLRLRHTPELTLKYDDSVEYGARINQVINDLKKTERSGEDHGKTDEQLKGNS